MPNNLALLKYGAPPPAQCWGATATIQEDAPLDEDASDDAPLNDDVLRGIAASGGARQPEADEASLASRATSAHTVIPTPHGRARMGERAVSVKELQTAKKYGTVTRARNGRDGAVRWKIEHNGIVYITDRTQKLVITTYHQSPEEPEAKDARVRELVRQVRELSAERSEATNRLETAVAMLFIEHREEERRLEERLDALESDERLVAELAEVRVRPSQHALDILRRQEVTVEDLCDLTHAMLVAAGLDPVDVHMIWSKIEVLRSRKIARGKSRGGC